MNELFGFILATEWFRSAQSGGLGQLISFHDLLASDRGLKNTVIQSKCLRLIKGSRRQKAEGMGSGFSQDPLRFSPQELCYCENHVTLSSVHQMYHLKGQ